MMCTVDQPPHAPRALLEEKVSSSAGIVANKLIGLLGVLGLIGGLVLFEKNTGSIRRWLRDRAIEAYVEKIQPKVPFQIERVDLEASIEDLIQGKVSNLEIQLKWESFRGRLRGAIEVKKEGETDFLSVHYLPDLWVEHIPSGSRLSDVPVEMVFRLNRGKDSLVKFAVLIDSNRMKAEKTYAWSAFGLEIQRPEFFATFFDGNLVLQAGAKTIAQTSGQDQENAWSLSHFHSNFTAPLTIEPFQLGPQIEGWVQGDDLEVLRGESYSAVSLNGEKIHTQLELPGSSTRIKLIAGPLTLAAESQVDGWKAAWRLESPLSELRDGLLRFVGPQLSEQYPSLASTISDIRIREGRVRFQGQLDFLEKGSAWEKIADLTGEFGLFDVGMDWKAQALAVRGFHLSLPFKWKSATRGSFQVERFSYRRLVGELKESPIFIQSSGASGIQLDLPQGFPLRLDQVDWVEYPISVTIGLDPLSFKLQTKIEVKKTRLSSLLRRLCIPVERFPNTNFQVRLTDVSLGDERLQATGEVTIDVFGGHIYLKKIRFYDFFSRVPQLQFSAAWEQVRLDRLGEWLRFGEMDGSLEGYARDVTFLSWLPTEYDFRFEILPLQKRQIVFSPDAMKNTVRLIAGEDLKTLPGIADWLAFGWVSRMLGGYNVEYAGFTLLSRDGSIVMETLDPEEIFAKEQKHFILYGPRFKIPIRSRRYPVVLDAANMSNLTRHMLKQLGALKEDDDEPNEKKEETSQCLPADFDS